MPDELFALSPAEFGDMFEAYHTVQAIEDDKFLEAMAWQTSLLMSATGNYGKKGVDAKKLYKRQVDEYGNPVENAAKINPVSKEEKESKLNELLRKFKKI